MQLIVNHINSGYQISVSDADYPFRPQLTFITVRTPQEIEDLGRQLLRSARSLRQHQHEEGHGADSTVSLKVDQEASSAAKYDQAAIALGLEETARGQCYRGYALRAAKDLPGVSARERHMLNAVLRHPQKVRHVKERLLALALRLQREDPLRPLQSNRGGKLWVRVAKWDGKQGMTLEDVAASERFARVDGWLCADVAAPPEVWKQYPNRPLTVIRWNAGKCPVHPLVHGRVQSAWAEAVDEGWTRTRLLSVFNWRTEGTPTDIVAFTITEGCEEKRSVRKGGM